MLLLALPAIAGNVGGVRMAQGQTHIERFGLTMSAWDGMEVLERDILMTGPDGSMGVTFKDGSRVSLGPNSTLRISDYVFNPGREQYSFLARLAKGTAAFLTGQMSKLSPGAMAVETPTSTIGIRGTHFLVEVEEAKQ